MIATGANNSAQELTYWRSLEVRTLFAFAGLRRRGRFVAVNPLYSGANLAVFVLHAQADRSRSSRTRDRRRFYGGVRLRVAARPCERVRQLREAPVKKPTLTGALHSARRGRLPSLRRPRTCRPRACESASNYDPTHAER